MQRMNCGVGQCCALALVAAVILGTGGIAAGDEIQILSCPPESTEGIGRFSGAINYTPGAGSGVLMVTLTNTTPVATGGYITGFLFNIFSDDPAAAASLQAGPTHPFEFANGSGAPFGSDFDAGAALGGSFLGGGSPVSGIEVGDTGTFTFTITALDAASLQATDFIMGPYEFNFIVRFKGFEDGGSDKVPALRTCPVDFNGDGMVGPIDLSIMLAAWGPNPGSPADINEDGIVNGYDLVYLLGGWGPCGSD
jgi:hypothetical protein